MLTTEERCPSLCPELTPYAIQARALSWVSRVLQVQTRCTLAVSHVGVHLGPDESTWD